MTFPKARLVVSACLLLAWLGFLFFLVVERRTIILSKPQFMRAQAVIVADVRADGFQPDPMVTVKEVAWGQLADKEIKLPDLLEKAKEQGYQGPGVYVIPLTKRGGDFRIAPIPGSAFALRIYPWTPDVQTQLDEIVNGLRRLSPE